MRKISDKQTEGHSIKYLTNTPQNCQGHQKQGKSKKLPQPRGAQGDMTTKCNIDRKSVV